MCKKLIYILLFLFIPFVCFGATYYIRADGTDADPDCSESSACCAGSMDVSDHNGDTFSAGDIIYLCDDGGDFSTKLVPPSSGSSWTSPITYKAADGDTPKFVMLTEVSSWTDDLDGTYSKGSITNAYMLTEDGSLIQYATDATLTATASGESISGSLWFYDSTGDILHYKPNDGTLDTETLKIVDTADGAIRVDYIDYIVIDGITFEYFYYGIYGREYVPSSDVYGPKIQNCTFSYGRLSLISLTQETGVYSTEEITFTNNTLNYLGQPFRLGSNADGTGKHNNATISNNQFLNNQFTGADAAEVWEDIWGGIDAECLVVVNCNNCVIEGNYLNKQCPDDGILSYVNGSSEADNNIIRYNYLNDLQGTGIVIGGVGADTATGNLVHSNLIVNIGQQVGDDGALKSQRSNTPANKFYNNTIVNADISIHIAGTSDYSEFKNNVSISPSDHHISTVTAYSNHSFDYNFYDADGATMFYRNGDDSNLAEWQLDTSDDANSDSGTAEVKSNYSIKSRGSNLYNSGTDLSGTFTTGLATYANWPNPKIQTRRKWSIGAFVYKEKRAFGIRIGPF